jgi:hypothetical protein
MPWHPQTSPLHETRVVIATEDHVVVGRVMELAKELETVLVKVPAILLLAKPPEKTPRIGPESPVIHSLETPGSLRLRD